MIEELKKIVAKIESLEDMKQFGLTFEEELELQMNINLLLFGVKNL